MNLAGIDVGGGGVRVAASRGAESVRVAIDGPIHRSGGIDLGAVADVVNGVLDEAARALRVTGFDAVAIGMTGMPDLVPDPAPLARRARALARSVLIAGDAVTSHAGALGLGPGTVVAAGTGVTALSSNLRDRWKRADGWGLLLGDEGGGSWIGRKGLVAALRSADGRPGGSPALLTAMISRYGPSEEAVRSIHDAESPAHQLARFAPDVAAAALGGDDVAIQIWRRAAEHLADTALAAAGPLDVISWNGGVFGAGELLLAPFRARILSRSADSAVVTPLGDSAEGARLLAGELALGAEVGGTPHVYLDRG